MGCTVKVAVPFTGRLVVERVPTSKLLVEPGWVKVKGWLPVLVMVTVRAAGCAYPV